MIYPDELSQELNGQEILFAAERTIELARTEAEGDDEKACQLIISHLATLCYAQGMEAFTTQLRLKSKKLDTFEDGVYGVLLEAQKRWEWIVDYCRDKLDIHLHPMGMLVFMRYVGNYRGDTADEQAMISAIDRYAKELSDKAKGSLQEEAPVEVPDIDNFTGDETVLILEFFQLMDKIGTFYHDRDRYDTDEKREMHDRIVAIHRRIVNSQ